MLHGTAKTTLLFVYLKFIFIYSEGKQEPICFYSFSNYLYQDRAFALNEKIFLPHKTA